MYSPNQLRPHRGHSFVKTRARRPSAWVQGGFTLIELMVGIGIGLLVVVAAVGSLVFTQASSVVVGDSAQLQQKADMIFRNIGIHVTQAGALTLIPTAADPSKVVFDTSPTTGFTGYPEQDTGIPGGNLAIHGLEGAGAAPDTLRLSYQDDTLVRDCMGNRPLVPNNGVNNQFTLNAQGDLMCTGTTAAAAQSIADGVADFQVLYGVQTIGPQTQFFNAAGVGGNWAGVGVVQVCIELMGDNQANIAPPVIQGCRGQNLVNDGRLHKVFRRTFVMRNVSAPI